MISLLRHWYNNTGFFTFCHNLLCTAVQSIKRYKISTSWFIHHLYEDQQDVILDIISECEKAGNPDMVFEFASTSKVSFSGAGVAAIATSKANIEDLKKTMTVQTIIRYAILLLSNIRIAFVLFSFFAILIFLLS